LRPGDGPIFGQCLIWVLQACHASIIKLQQIHFPAAALAGSPFVGKPAMLERLGKRRVYPAKTAVPRARALAAILSSNVTRSAPSRMVSQRPADVKTIPHAFGFRPAINLDQLVDKIEAENYAANQRTRRGTKKALSVRANLMAEDSQKGSKR